MIVCYISLITIDLLWFDIYIYSVNLPINGKMFLLKRGVFIEESILFYCID